MNRIATPTTGMDTRDRLGTVPGYMPGFGNDFETEALPGALPQGQNSPQKCNYGLYAEQLSGTAFTAPRGQNERTWCYRIRPSVRHTGRFEKIELPYWKSAPLILEDVISLGQYRWDPVPLPGAGESLTWLTGMRTVTTAGDVHTQVGMASHVYVVNASMEDAYFYSADSEMLVVPQQGRLRFCTELGVMALLQRLAAVRGRLSLCADQAAAAKWWLSMPMASVSAEGPMPKALSTRRTSPLMPGCRHQGRACPLRRARMTSNPLIVA